MPIRLFLEECPLWLMKVSGKEKFPTLERKIYKHSHVAQYIHPKKESQKTKKKTCHCYTKMVLEDTTVPLNLSSKNIPSAPENTKCCVEVLDDGKKYISQIKEYFSSFLDKRKSDV